MHCKFHRRQFLRRSAAAASGVAAASLWPSARCTVRAASLPAAPTSPVAIERCDSYDSQPLFAKLKRALDAIGGIKPLVSGKTVLTRSNLRPSLLRQ